MKESIFFNSEQIKIIHWYNMIFQWVFKYWVGIAAWILSVVGSWWIFASGYFSWIYLLEKQDEGRVSEAMLHYNDKARQVASFTGLEGMVLNWKITVDNWRLIAKDMLLVSSWTSFWLTLPRLVDITYDELEKFTKWLDQEYYSDAYMNAFFHTVLMKAMTIDNFWGENPSLFAMKSSMKDLFGLGCTITVSKDSFVCKSYVKSFLNRFYMYDLSKSMEEINQYFNALKSNYDYKNSMCKGLIMYWKYSDSIDNRLSELFRSCGSSDYNQFVLLRDFLALAKPFDAWYVETQAYTDPYINEYKLYSLQQMLYKELLNSADVKSTMSSYLGFIREVLTKEGTRQEQLLSPFAKSFAYRFNMTILSPYYKDENSKMDKDDRTSFNSELLALNYWDIVANFPWLQADSRYVISVEESKEEEEYFGGQSLRETFMQNYLPPNFSVFSVDTGDDENLLVVKGQDGKTSFILEALLRYESLQLSVVHVNIDKAVNEPNEGLTNYINSLIENTNSNYSLNQVLSLMDQYKEFTETPTEQISLCDQIKAKYAEELILSCEDTIIELVPPRWWDSGLVYTFYIQNGALTDVKVNDEVLETKILNDLDLSDVDAASTFYMIVKILSYEAGEKETDFGLKDYLAVSEVINKYLGDIPITTENWEIKINFSLWGVDFIWTYDILTHEINPIAINLWKDRRPVTVRGFSIVLDDEHLEELNEIKSDAKEYLKKINPALVEKYFTKNKK